MMCCPLQQTYIFGTERIQPVTSGKSHGRLWFEQSWPHDSHSSDSHTQRSSEPVQHFRQYGDREKDSWTLQTFSARYVLNLRDTDSARIVKKDAPTRHSDTMEQDILYDVQFVSTEAGTWCLWGRI